MAKEQDSEIDLSGKILQFKPREEIRKVVVFPDGRVVNARSSIPEGDFKLFLHPALNVVSIFDYQRNWHQIRYGVLGALTTLSLMTIQNNAVEVVVIQSFLAYVGAHSLSGLVWDIQTKTRFNDHNSRVIYYTEEREDK